MDLSNMVILVKAGEVNVNSPNQNQKQEQEQKQEQNAGTVQNSGTEQAQQTQQGGAGFMGIGGIAIYIVGLIALFYFFAIRPQKKKEKELSNIQNSIQPGDWVMTSSGFYGKVVDIADQVFVVEFGTNKGVRIPVRKSEIIGNKEPNLTVSSTSVSPEDDKK